MHTRHWDFPGVGPRPGPRRALLPGLSPWRCVSPPANRLPHRLRPQRRARQRPRCPAHL